MLLESPLTSTLCLDPDRTHRINANSFQQNAITTANGWQYAAFYPDVKEGSRNSGCFVNIARRHIDTVLTTPDTGTWETLSFEDYEQTTDDGHNTISIGVCTGDGTIHIAFDHHCDQLKFRISEFGVAKQPEEYGWAASIFTKTQDFLPGIALNDLMKEVTYPTFVNVEDDLLLTYRIGQAGQGSDILYHYSSITHQYRYLGQHLTGVSNSPYINGLDYRLSRLHLSWCYRNFVPFDLFTNAHRQQAGPNGPENNHDLNYAFSDDLGETWRNSEGGVLAKLGNKKGDEVEATIKPGFGGARVFEIPMESGILNQEAQAADWEGGFWVLNREKTDGEETWIVYYRNQTGKWTRSLIKSASRPTETGSRGSICVDRERNVYLILPGNTDSSLSIMQGLKEGGYKSFEQVWRSDGFDGEPLVDVQRLNTSHVLSIFTRTAANEDGRRHVVVLDFVLPGAGEGK